MIQAQLIQGNATELLSYLQQHRDKQNLTLIVPETAPDRPHTLEPSTRNTPDQMVTRNGVPLFPTSRTAQPVTIELVQRLLEEEVNP
jgi:hypothetical protein